MNRVTVAVLILVAAVLLLGNFPLKRDGWWVYDYHPEDFPYRVVLCYGERFGNGCIGPEKVIYAHNLEDGSFTISNNEEVLSWDILNPGWQFGWLWGRPLVVLDEAPNSLIHIPKDIIPLRIERGEFPVYIADVIEKVKFTSQP